ncbi:hypothetical protein OBPA_17560 [Polaribacter sp. OB-PA-B3]
MNRREVTNENKIIFFMIDWLINKSTKLLKLAVVDSYISVKKKPQKTVFF